MIVGRTVNSGNITGKMIKDAYKKAFNLRCFGHFHIADETYYPANVELIKRVIREDIGDTITYVSDDFDCDNFAFSLMGAFNRNMETARMPIFITWVLTPEGGHALLSFYSGGKVWMIEPQDDSIFGVPPDWKLWMICG